MKIAVLAAIAIVVAAAIALHFRATPTPVRPPLAQDAYVWQRSWTPAVREAVRTQSPLFNRLVVLAAEITPGENNHVVEVHPDYEAIKDSVHSIGLAVRVGPLPSSRRSALNPDSIETKLLCDTAHRAINAARTAGMEVAEFQIDFDCAESKLSGYVNWVRAVRSAVTPVPVIITALPSWLKHAEFAPLAQAAGGFVIQVHSLHQPAGPECDLNLCDPAEARRAVALASTFGVPFRVALPTYSYLAGFSPAGKLLGLSAEGPVPAWPSDTFIKQMDSDAADIATLVREWTSNPAENMAGIIWYRLPVEGDQLNWPAVTLRAVMNGDAPKPQIVAVVERSGPGLVDLYLKNVGNAPATDHCEIFATWAGATEEASESLGSFDHLEQEPGKVIFRQSSTARRRIAPGERIAVGWLRLSKDTDVQAHLTALSN